MQRGRTVRRLVICGMQVARVAAGGGVQRRQAVSGEVARVRRSMLTVSVHVSVMVMMKAVVVVAVMVMVVMVVQHVQVSHVVLHLRLRVVSGQRRGRVRRALVRQAAGRRRRRLGGEVLVAQRLGGGDAAAGVDAHHAGQQRHRVGRGGGEVALQRGGTTCSRGFRVRVIHC